MKRNNGSQVFSQEPAEALRPFVKRFVVVEFSAAHADSHLPDTGLVAAFPFRGSCRLEDGSEVTRPALTGLHARIRSHVHSRGNALALAMFTPAGAAAFVRHPLDELSNTTVRLDALLGEAPALAHLAEQLGEAPNHFRRVQRLQDFFLARIRDARRDPLVTAAVQWIERAPAGARIRELVRYIGLSQSALERRFRCQVGTSPKKFAALVRLKAIARLRATGLDFTSIAHAAGYCDQSHFTHDFKRVTGFTPEGYFGAAATD